MSRLLSSFSLGWVFFLLAQCAVASTLTKSINGYKVTLGGTCTTVYCELYKGNAKVSTFGNGASVTHSATLAEGTYHFYLYSYNANWGGSFLQETDSVSISLANNVPTISAIGSKTIQEDTVSPAYGFTVSDVETVSSSLVVSARHNNSSLISKLSLSGRGANRSIRITPKRNAFGSATITISASDGVKTGKRSFALTISPVNDPPKLSSFPNMTVNEDSGVSSSILFNASDMESNGYGGGLTLNVTSSNRPLVKITKIILPGRAWGGSYFQLKPKPNANGKATISVSVSDGSRTTTKSFLYTVRPINDRPVASAVTFSGHEDNSIKRQVALNDTDGESVTLKVNQPSYGSVSVNSNSLIYIPPENWYGTTSFTYRARDSAGTYSDWITAPVSIASVNDAPTVSSTSFLTNEDQPVNRSISIMDIEGDSTTLNIVTHPTHGSATVSGKKITYTPADNWHGLDSLSYRATDALGAKSATKTAKITVNSVADKPIASRVAFAGSENKSITRPVTLTDPDGDTVALEIADQPAYGSATINGNSLTYTPPSGWHGRTQFVYHAVDSTGLSGADMIAFVYIKPNDRAPVLSVTDPLANGGNFTVSISNIGFIDGEEPDYTWIFRENGTYALNQSGISDSFVEQGNKVYEVAACSDVQHFQYEDWPVSPDTNGGVCYWGELVTVHYDVPEPDEPEISIGGLEGSYDNDAQVEISWSDIDFSEKYELVFTGRTVETARESGTGYTFYIPSEGDWSVKIRACNEFYECSAYSKPIGFFSEWQVPDACSQGGVLDPSEVSVSFQYDALGRVELVEDSKGCSRNYEYDPAGNRKEVSEKE